MKIYEGLNQHWVVLWIDTQGTIHKHRFNSEAEAIDYRNTHNG